MKNEYQIPEAVREDIVACFADEETLLLYSHFYDKGKDECMEAMKQAKDELESGIREIKAMRSVLLSNPSDDDGVSLTISKMQAALDSINNLLK